MTGLSQAGGAAGGETFNTGDVVNGNGLTKVSLIANGNTAGTGEIVDLNDIASVNVNLTANTAVNAVEYTNVAALNVTQGVAGMGLTVNNATLGTVYGASAAGRDFVETIAFAGTTGTADTAQLSVTNTGNSTTDTTFNVATGNTIEAVTLATSGTNYVTVNGGTAAAKYTITGSGTNEVTIGSAATTMTIDASGSTGVNIIDVGGLLSTTDSVVGGSGFDALVANLTTGVQIIPTVSGVEELDLTFTAAAIYNASKTTGVTEVDLTPVGAVAANITNLAATATTINLGDDWGNNAAIAATGAVNIGYATGSNSDVSLNVGTVSALANPAVSSTGALTFTNNSGALDINSVGDAANTLGAVTANRASSLSVQGVAQNLTTGALSATGATEVTIDGSLKNTQVTSAAAATLTVDETMSTFNLVSGTGTAGLRNTGAGTAVTQTAANGTDIDVTYNVTSGAQAAAIDAVTVTGGATAGDAVNANFNINGGSGAATVGALTVAGIAANTTGAATASLQANATKGAVNVAALDLRSAAAAATATVDLTANGGLATLALLNLANTDATGGSTHSTTAAITIEAVADTDTATITSLDDVGTVTGVQGISTITATGAGTININALNAGGFVNTSDTVIDATGATGAVTINLASSAAGADLNVVLGNAAATSLGNTVTTGAGADVVVGGTGVDVIRTGNGADNVNAGAGNDNITGGLGIDFLTGGTGNNTFVYTAAAADAAVVNAGAAGDNTSATIVAVTSITVGAAGVTFGPNAGVVPTQTGSVEVITDIDSADVINLGNAAIAAWTNNNNLGTGAAANNQASVVSGSYNATTGLFTSAAGGADSVVMWDSDATAAVVLNSVVLVGVTSAEAGAATFAAGVVTF